MQASKRVCCYSEAQCSGYQRSIGGRRPHTVFSSRVHILNEMMTKAVGDVKSFPDGNAPVCIAMTGLALLHRDSMKLLAEVYKVQVEVAWCAKGQDSGLLKRWQI
jgi:hypothetical protein